MCYKAYRTFLVHAIIKWGIGNFICHDKQHFLSHMLSATLQTSKLQVKTWPHLSVGINAIPPPLLAIISTLRETVGYHHHRPLRNEKMS